MSMRSACPPTRSRDLATSHGRRAGRALVTLLGAAVALAGCGSSSHRLIPVASAGPLTSDVEAVERAAESGNGSCTATEAAILKLEQDYDALPSSLDAGLRNTLHQGVTNLRARALVLCAQPLAQSTVTTTKTSTTRTAPATTQTTTTPPTTTTTRSTTTPTTPATTPTTTTTPTTPSTGGGTAAPEAGKSTPGSGESGGGTGAGEAAEGAAGSQEGSK